MGRSMAVVSAFLMCVMGCQSDTRWQDMNTVADLASEKTARKVSSLFKNNFTLKGVVVKVEDHPVSPLSSSGIHGITYHVEYKLDGPLSPTPGILKVESKKYMLPITRCGMIPELKVGDEVEITGWIEKPAAKTENPGPDSRTGNP